jgi:hypothetical protein
MPSCQCSASPEKHLQNGAKPAGSRVGFGPASELQLRRIGIKEVIEVTPFFASMIAWQELSSRRSGETMDHLHRDLGVIGPNDAIEVTLDHAANVQLLDSVNYDHYRNRQAYRYYGGHVTTSPFRIRPPYQGHWHLVIDLGGMPGTVRASGIVLSEPSAIAQ